MHIPAWIHVPDSLYWWPGIYALIVTLIAGIVPTHIRFYEHKWVKISYAIVLALLVGLEIASISHDRYEQDKNHIEELRKQNSQFEQQMEYLMGFKQSMVGELEQVNATLRKARAEAPNQKSFKVTVLELAKDILEFSADREETAPKFSAYIPAGREKQDQQAFQDMYVAYTDKTVADFRRKFDVRIADVLPRLDTMQDKYFTPNNLNTKGADTFCVRANNPGAVQLCGMNLRVLGSALP